MMGGEGRKAGCPPCSGGTGELGALGRFGPSSQKGRGEIKAEGEDGERFAVNGTQMFPTWVPDFLTDPVPSFIEVMRW